jgi:hypothetical protein
VVARPLPVVVCALSALVAVGCRAHEYGIPIAPSPPSTLCHDPRLGPEDVCMPAALLETLLRATPLPVRAVRPTSGGTAGARLAWLAYPSEGLVIRAKWKPAPPGGERLNNVPRKELAAYEIQKLFLAPDEYVVPVTVVRCLPMDFHDVRFGGHGATFRGSRCVLGTLAYWVEHLTHAGVRDPGRFERDPAYLRTVANLNLLTYVIDHRDTRSANFMISKSRRHPRAFAVDNGLAFSGIRNPLSWFVRDWARINVPAVPRDTIARLRRVDRAALDRLAVAVQFRRTPDGQLEEAPPTAPTDEKMGVRVTDGTVQLGLTRKEIDGIERRIRALLERVDAGELTLF